MGVLIGPGVAHQASNLAGDQSLITMATAEDLEKKSEMNNQLREYISQWRDYSTSRQSNNSFRSWLSIRSVLKVSARLRRGQKGRLLRLEAQTAENYTKNVTDTGSLLSATS